MSRKNKLLYEQFSCKEENENKIVAHEIIYNVYVFCIIKRRNINLMEDLKFYVSKNRTKKNSGI